MKLHSPIRNTGGLRLTALSAFAATLALALPMPRAQQAQIPLPPGAGSPASAEPSTSDKRFPEITVNGATITLPSWRWRRIN